MGEEEKFQTQIFGVARNEDWEEFESLIDSLIHWGGIQRIPEFGLVRKKMGGEFQLPNPVVWEECFWT
jgi:hypothetical protein